MLVADLTSSTELNAPKAQQWVRLRPGSRPEQFKAQGDAISAIEQHIIGTLRGGGLEVHAQDAMLAGRRRTLYISRRVFEKVCEALSHDDKVLNMSR